MEQPEKRTATRLKGPDPAHLDPPIRELVGLINSKGWAHTFGCCAGPSFHPEGDDTYGFYLSIAATRDTGAKKLASWHSKVAARTPHPEARLYMRELDKHGFGHMERCRGFHVSIEWLADAAWEEKISFTLRVISRMEDAWVSLFG